MFYMTNQDNDNKIKPKVQELISKTKVEWLKGMQFRAKYDLPQVKELIMDEPPEFGGDGEGPNAARVVASAVGDCLSASLLFCLTKSRIPVESLKSTVKTKVARNEENLLRVKDLQVEIQVKLKDTAHIEKSEQCRELFEKYCIVSDSLRKGIPINVNVKVL